jgi:putative acyl-CoA dehydrogenase
MDATHEVFNQPEPLADYNLFDANRPLRDALEFNAPQLQLAPLEHLGDVLGSREMQVHARLANTHPPVLHTHDRFGRRVDEVEFHPSYHALMKAACTARRGRASRLPRTSSAPPASCSSPSSSPPSSAPSP